VVTSALVEADLDDGFPALAGSMITAAGVAGVDLV
jgi:hypothetical protein